MRVSNLLLLPAVASAAMLQGRQLGGNGGKEGMAGMLGSIGGQTKVAGIDSMEPQIRKGATRRVVKFGPYTLRASVSTLFNFLISAFAGSCFSANSQLYRNPKGRARV
jgi:hypothetical protein